MYMFIYVCSLHCMHAMIPQTGGMTAPAIALVGQRRNSLPKLFSRLYAAHISASDPSDLSGTCKIRRRAHGKNDKRAEATPQLLDSKLGFGSSTFIWLLCILCLVCARHLRSIAKPPSLTLPVVESSHGLSSSSVALSLWGSMMPRTQQSSSCCTHMRPRRLQYPTTGSARAGGLPAHAATTLHVECTISNIRLVDQWVTHRKPARLARMPLRSQLIHDLCKIQH